MAYTVYNNDGSVLINLAAGDVDIDTTSLDLVGKNVNNYGEYINNNFVRLLTSFANTTGPRSPKTGQLWFDSGNTTLKVYNGTSWSSLLNAFVNSVEPSNPRSGEFWYDSNNNQLKVRVSSSWQTVGPAVNSSLGKFGVEPPPNPYEVKDSLNNDRKCAVVYSYGSPVIVLSSATFTANPSTSQLYFGTSTAVVYSGTNILSTLSVNKDLIVRGSLKVFGGIYETPNKTLTAAYNSGWVGAFTATYTATNNIIRLQVLPYLFSTATNTWTQGVSLGSEVKVLLTSGTFTATEVRHFRLEDTAGSISWKAYEIYPATGTNYFGIVSTYTNVVRIS